MASVSARLPCPVKILSGTHSLHCRTRGVAPIEIANEEHLEAIRCSVSELRNLNAFAGYRLQHLRES